MGFQVWANRRNYHIFDRRDDINDNLDWPKRWSEMDEDKRMKAILRYAKMLQYSTSIILVTFKDDADMAEELTEVVDRLCEILGLLGIGNMDEAERLNIELVKKIKSHATT